MIALMAWRNIWRNKARSLVIMISIMLGLFAGISVLSLYKGMIHARVRTVIDREAGHIQIHHPKFKEDNLPRFVIEDTSAVLQIRQMPQVSLVTARAVTSGMLTTASNSAGVNILGIKPDEEKLLSKLDQKIVEGTYFEGDTRNPIVIGKKLATKMKLKLKSKMVLTFVDTTNTMVSAAYRVVGIYESDNAPFDERMVYTTHRNLTALLATGGTSHEIAIILKRDEDLAATASILHQHFPALSVETWKEISPETELMVDTTDQYSYIILIIIMLALAFGIINTMLMAILERTREIGMMVALGMNKVRLFSLILFETLFLTFAGTPMGFIGSWILINHFNRNGLQFSSMDEEVLRSFGFQNLIYPEFPWDKVLGLVIIVAATALLSGLLPALKALRLKPTEALRK
jgi:ABC-type lipoprotein release transport system permease subunit